MDSKFSEDDWEFNSEEETNNEDVDSKESGSEELLLDEDSGREWNVYVDDISTEIENFLFRYNKMKEIQRVRGGKGSTLMKRKRRFAGTFW